MISRPKSYPLEVVCRETQFKVDENEKLMYYFITNMHAIKGWKLRQLVLTESNIGLQGHG